MGCFLDGPTHAVIWSDSEQFRIGSTTAHAHVPKLTINALAPAVGCGMGQCIILREADEALMASETYDDATAKVARGLRVGMSRNASIFDRRPTEYAPRYITTGWSISAGCMLAHEYGIENFFAPVLTPFHLSPWVDRGECWRPASERDLLRVAADQVDELRKTVTGARGGTLTVADLQPGFVAVRAYPGFAAEYQSAHQEESLCS